MIETKERSYQRSVRKDYNTNDLRLGWQSFSF
jgi:hypothetical protein